MEQARREQSGKRGRTVALRWGWVGPSSSWVELEAPMVTASSLGSRDLDDLFLKPVWQACHIHDVIQLLCVWATMLDQLTSLEERERTTKQLLGRGGIRTTAPETKGRASCGLTWTSWDF